MKQELIDQIQSTDVLHWKNLSIEDIVGEVWVDIFGFEGIYKISNFGRIKTFNKMGASCDGRIKIQIHKKVCEFNTSEE